MIRTLRAPHREMALNRRTEMARWLALIGGVLNPIAFVTMFTIGGLLRPGYSQIHQAISDLGVGPNGWLLDIGGAIHGLLLIAFAGAFALSMQSVLAPSWRWLGTVLLALRGAAFVMVAIFTEAPATLRFHVTGSLIGLTSLVFAMLVIGTALVRVTRWRRWGTFTLLMCLLTLILVVLENLTFRGGTPIGSAHLGGMLERSLYVVSLSWFVALGWRLFRGVSSTRNAARRPPLTREPATGQV
jgi:hypothetical membrane protein